MHNLEFESHLDLPDVADIEVRFEEIFNDDVIARDDGKSSLYNKEITHYFN